MSKKNNENDGLVVPEFSFGTKAVIRPLPTSCLFNSETSSIKTLADLIKYIKTKNYKSTPKQLNNKKLL